MRIEKIILPCPCKTGPAYWMSDCRRCLGTGVIETTRGVPETQEEFDEFDAIVVHLTVDDRQPARALCSGEVIDPDRWADSKRPRKQCQACYLAARRV